MRRREGVSVIAWQSDFCQWGVRFECGGREQAWLSNKRALGSNTYAASQVRKERGGEDEGGGRRGGATLKPPTNHPAVLTSLRWMA